MNHLRFTLYTLIGAGIWVSVLAWIGYFIGAERELIVQYSHQAVLGAIALCVVTGLCYAIIHRRRIRLQEGL
jgi:membrane protein DedA with SNARE-associated domain